MSKLRYVGSEILGNCPAQVYMDTGVIEINADVWNKYDSFQQEFIIQHELGHYNLQTDSEFEADRYAITHIYGKYPRSLKRSLQTLYKIGIIDNERLRNLYKEALMIDAKKNNNKRAINELKNLGITKMKQKITTGSSPFVTKNNRIDGNQETDTSTLAQTMRDRFFSQSESQSKKTGIVLGDHFVKYEVILLAIITFLLLKK